MHAQTLIEAPSSAPKQRSFLGREERVSPFFQPKLTVNTPGDAYEQEADAVADQVMGMQSGEAAPPQALSLTPVAPVQRQCAECEGEEELQRKEEEGEEKDVQRMPMASNVDDTIQRQCAACEQEEAQRKESGGGDASGKAAPSLVSDVLSSGGGQAMDGGTRQFMESRFGHDFGQVRIHTDSRAAESATLIQAKAYTSGSNIVFGAGQYQPESESGKRLLAHELAHVGQQGGNNFIQRVIGDFEVAQLPSNHGLMRNRVFFYSGHDSIPFEERHKITDFVARENAITGTTNHSLELVGLASEEGPRWLNQRLAQNRAQNVKNALTTEGYPSAPGSITIRSLTGEQANRADYAEMRSVELLRPNQLSLAGNANSIVDCAVVHPTQYPARFMALLTTAQTQVTHAASGLTSTRTLDTNRLLNKYFGDASDATVSSLHSRLVGTDGDHAQLEIYRNATNHRCREACPSAAASNSGQGNHAMLTLCPAIFQPDRPERETIRSLIHEAAHGAPAIGASDIGYRFTRMIPQINTSMGLSNSDSIALFVQEMNGLTPLSFGRDNPDTLTGFSNDAERREVQTAMAFIELYVVRDSQLIQYAYGAYRSVQNGRSRSLGFYQSVIDSLGRHFGFNTATVAQGETNTRKIAAILDRVTRMESTMQNVQRNTAGNVEDAPLNIHKTTTPTSWDRGSESAGMGVAVGPDFFALSGQPVPQLKVLLAALVAATPGISSGLIPHYVEMIDELRFIDSLPDPQLR